MNHSVLYYIGTAYQAFFAQNLAETGEDMTSVVDEEFERQEINFELIAFEKITSKSGIRPLDNF